MPRLRAVKKGHTKVSAIRKAFALGWSVYPRVPPPHPFLACPCRGKGCLCLCHGYARRIK